MNSLRIAQVNVARMRAALEDPVMRGFVARLDEINALADGSPGFVWRLKTDVGNATSLRPYDDDRIIINLSTWETVEDLRNFVYGTIMRTSSDSARTGSRSSRPRSSLCGGSLPGTYPRSMRP